MLFHRHRYKWRYHVTLLGGKAYVSKSGRCRCGDHITYTTEEASVRRLKKSDLPSYRE